LKEEAASLDGDLVEYVRNALDRSSRIKRRSAIVTSASWHRRHTETFLTRCAWCQRLRLDEEWVPSEEVPPFLLADLDDRSTHGICPSCFSEAERVSGDGVPLSITAVVIRTNGPVAVECLGRALAAYPLREHSDFAVEVTLESAGTVSGLLARVSRCLEENHLAPVTVELTDRIYVLG
jgi:hypothetical protein